MIKVINDNYENINFITHFFGIILGIIGMIYLIILNIFSIISNKTNISMFIYIISIILLYSASCYYHYLNYQDNKKLIARKIDHSMIYLLIAGSYAPILINYMSDNSGIIFTLGLYLLAIFGIIIKLLWFNAPRLLSTSIYIIMGWSILIDIDVLKRLPISLIYLLLFGGLSYSIGAIIYIIKKPNFKYIGFHGIFHIFILLGTFVHLISYYIYLF